jgi:2-methylisocitrate lyase-like PEP mutase family enzyme
MPQPDPPQASKSRLLLNLHAGPGPVLLVNAWDIASARIVEDAGFPAIATTSAGIAFAQGFPDGEEIPPSRMFARIREIAEAVNVPVTADVEAGYGDTPDRAAQTARDVMRSGAVGMNFEDATGDPSHPLADLALHLERIRAIRETADNDDGGLVLNARTDAYLLEVGEASQRYDECVRRLAAYRDAGADCVFVPGLVDRATIGRLVADVKCPLNILAVPGAPSVPELSALGVRRISLGSGPMRAALGSLRRLAEEVRREGTYTHLTGAPSYAEMNAIMKTCRNAKDHL